MPSTYDRLKYLEQANREGRLQSLLFSPDGPQALLPALPELITLIEEAWRHQAALPYAVTAALQPLIEPRP